MLFIANETHIVVPELNCIALPDIVFDMIPTAMALFEGYNPLVNVLGGSAYVIHSPGVIFNGLIIFVQKHLGKSKDENIGFVHDNCPPLGSVVRES